MAQEIPQIDARIREQSRFIAPIKAEVHKVIVGQEYLIDRLLVGLLCQGHILIEGVPGLGKTLAVKTLADAIDASFVRSQFTPDLLPADVTGTLVFNPQDGRFVVRRGPIFANIVLADEVNRAPPKVQSALLEAMQERQVSIGGTTYPLAEPFMVLATQNPIEQEGTYPLPEAQLDRFLLKVIVTYPSRLEERQILEQGLAGQAPPVQRVTDANAILAARRAVPEVYMEDGIKDYAVQIVTATRHPDGYRLGDLRGLIAYGASPRATVYLAQAARAYAFVRSRGYVTPDDVKAVAMDALRHRVIVTYEAEAEEVTSEDVVRRVLEGVEVP
ncbi:MAG: AAA family ATPase [Dehalococcoidia bacterium]